MFLINGAENKKTFKGFVRYQIVRLVQLRYEKKTSWVRWNDGKNDDGKENKQKAVWNI